MGKKNAIIDYSNMPETLDNHPFFGLKLDEEQKYFRNEIWNNKNLIVFCNACAGTGKTTIATATAELLVKYGRYDGIVYVASPTMEQKQGYLAGSLEEKSEPYFEPFYQALNKLGINYSTGCVGNIMNQKNGTAYIECMTHTFLRGCNFENKVVILDETQNYYLDELKKVLTRIHDNCKVIIIGHAGQIDLYAHPEKSGFISYIKHFSGDNRCSICKLTHNYRGWISNHADELEF